MLTIQIHCTPITAHVTAAALRAQITNIREHAARTVADVPSWDCSGFHAAVSSLESVLFAVENAIEANPA